MRSEEFQLHRQRLHRFVARMVGESDAEDLLQEIQVRVLKADAAVTKAWLFTVANNLCIDHLRRIKPRGLADASVVADPRSMEDGLERDELRAALWKAIDELPAEQRQIFLLREESGLSFKEIAGMLGIPLNTALGRMHYALEKLRKNLAVYR